MAASVAVEGRLCRIAAFRISFPKSGRDKTGAGGMGDAIPDDSTGKQIDDSAKIDSGIVEFKIGDIADLYLIGPICSKMPLQQISFFAVL